MAKTIVMVLGVVFIIIGVWGLFGTPIAGLFAVNMLHDIVHIVSGVLAIIFAMRGEDGARGFSKVFGVIYLLVAILGFAAPAFMANLLAINGADNILHLVLGVVLLAVGFLGRRNSAMTAA